MMPSEATPQTVPPACATTIKLRGDSIQVRTFAAVLFCSQAPSAPGSLRWSATHNSEIDRRNTVTTASVSSTPARGQQRRCPHSYLSASTGRVRATINA